MAEGCGGSWPAGRDAARGPGASAVVVIGASLSPACGVRDHAELLAGALAREGLDCRLRWLVRRERSLGGARAEIGRWRRGLAAELARRRPDAVLLHYSVFSLSHRGVPLFAGPLLASLRRARIPVVTVLHEYAYPWRRGDWRALAWALTQRLALIQAMRLTSGALVAGDERARWLRSRSWLPARRVLLAPVFSNLPPPRTRYEPPTQGGSAVLGLFGYAYQGAAITLVLDALRELRAGGADVCLTLLGAPGASSRAGESWRAQARTRGLQDALSFTGRLPAQELSDALAACAVLLFIDAAGPTPRKGTLAGSLASGRPVVALDGPQTWLEPVNQGALLLAPSTARGLAEAIAGLLEDPAAGAAVGSAGRAFAQSAMVLHRSADAVAGLIEQARRDGESEGGGGVDGGEGAGGPQARARAARQAKHAPR